MDDKSIQHDLANDARHIAERIPRDMANKKSKDAFIKRVRCFVAETGLTQPQLGGKVGYDKAVINQFLKGKYNHNVDALIRKLATLMDDHARQGRRTRNDAFIRTAVAEKIWAVIKHAVNFSNENEGKIALIIGDSGHGKSHCLREYARAQRNGIYVELDDTMTITGIFRKIASEFRQVRKEVSGFGLVSTIAEHIIEALRDMHVVIILDEASGLKVSHLDKLRQVIAVKSKCPLILSGNADLKATVIDPTDRKGHKALDQFRSRLTTILDLDVMAGEKEGGLYTAEDIRKLYQYGGLRLTGDGVKVLQRIAKTPFTGRLRTCGYVVEALHIYEKAKKKGYIDEGLIKEVIGDLGLPLQNNLPMVLHRDVEPVETQVAASAG